MSEEDVMVQRMAEMEERLHHAEMINRERRHDVILLSNQLANLAGKHIFYHAGSGSRQCEGGCVVRGLPAGSHKAFFA